MLTANNYGKYDTAEMTELAKYDAFLEAQKSILNELIDIRLDLMCGREENALRRVTRLVNELKTDIEISTKKEPNIAGNDNV